MSEEGQNINPDDQNTEPTAGNDQNTEPIEGGNDNQNTEPIEGGNDQNQNPEEGGNTEGGDNAGEGNGEGSDSSSTEEEAPQPVNCWQYSRDVYLLGRSWKYRYLTEDERAAIIEFISAMAETRPGYVDYINIKAGNPPAAEFVDEEADSSASESSDEGNAGEGEGEAQEERR